MMSKISLQRMQLVAGCIHVPRHAGYVKSSKKSAKTVGMFWLNSGFRAELRKAFQPLVPIALNHSYSVSIHYTICQQFNGKGVGRLFIEPIEMLYAWGAKDDDALSKLRRRRKKHTALGDKERKGQ